MHSILFPSLKYFDQKLYSLQVKITAFYRQNSGLHKQHNRVSWYAVKNAR